MTDPTCASCGQRLLLATPGRTLCAACKDPFEHAGWVGDAYRLDARDPDRLADVLPGVVEVLAETCATRRVNHCHTNEGTDHG